MATEALDREIRHAEQALYRTQIAGDVEAIRPWLADDLVYIHSTGVAETREAYLKGVVDRLYEYGTIASRDTRIRALGDAVFMDGIVEMTVAARGAPKQPIALLFCLLWVRQGGTWRLAFRQATRLGATTG